MEGRAGRSRSMICLGTLILFMGIGPNEIEIHLVGLGLGEKFAAAGEGFQIEELIFDQAMHRFDIALVGVRRGRDAEMLAVSQRGGEAGGLAGGIVASDEFAAIVSLPGQVAQIDAAAIQVLLDARGEDRAGRRGTFLCESPEQQATANLACRVFHQR